MPSITDTTDTGEKDRVTRSLRRRANIDISVKGVRTYSVTIDATGYSLEEQLEELDLLVLALEARCQSPEAA